MPIIIGGINDRITTNNDLLSDNFLQVNCCGIFENISEESRTHRPNGRIDFQIILVIDGFLSIYHEDKLLKISKNQFVLIPPNVENNYEFSNPIHTTWIHFSGTNAEKILNSYNINSFTAYTVINTGIFKHYAEKIIKELQIKNSGYVNICNAYLLQFLTQLKRKTDEMTRKEIYSSTPDINITIDEMKTNFSTNTDIEYYAKMCNLSTSRYSHIFTEKMSRPPHKYITMLRIDHAKYLLENTNAKISDISKSVGNYDQFYFTKVFKKHTGVTPSNFRKNSKLT